MSKNRRRTAHRAEIEREVAEAAEPLPDLARSRRRSTHQPATAAPEDEATEQAEAGDSRYATNRSRRRSTWPEAETGETAGQQPEGSAEPAAGALSGQLPHGADRRAGEVSTAAGRYLRQAARDDAPAKYGEPTGEVDDSARRVWEIAFGLVVRRRFDPETPLAEISRTVATAVHEHAAAALPMLDAEMLVRHALGELVPVGDLDGGCLVAVHLLLFASIADELALGDEELDAIIAEAEEKSSALSYA